MTLGNMNEFFSPHGFFRSVLGVLGVVRRGGCLDTLTANAG